MPKENEKAAAVEPMVGYGSTPIRGTGLRKFLTVLSDIEILEMTEMAYSDLKKAANEQNNSEWHMSCFAAVYILSCEMKDRGLKIK